MAMNVGSDSGDNRDDDGELLMDINTTPLIDVMLVLIIMLIITIPVQLHSVNLNMPQNQPPPQVLEPVVVQVNVATDGRIWWNQEELPDRAALDARLRLAAAQAVQPELHLRAEKDAPYGAVAMVLSAAQTLGVTQLGMVGNERFAP